MYRKCPTYARTRWDMCIEFLRDLLSSAQRVLSIILEIPKEFVNPLGNTLREVENLWEMLKNSTGARSTGHISYSGSTSFPQMFEHEKLLEKLMAKRKGPVRSKIHVSLHITSNVVLLNN
jgi:hypothetical protein